MVAAIECRVAGVYGSVMIVLWARRLRRSFGYAIRGVRVAGSGSNLRIQVVAAVVVTALALGFGMTGPRLGLVVISIGAVLSAEIMNTAIERTCDFVAEEHGLDQDPRIRDIKDLAAAAVLVVALAAVAIGVIAFSPYLG
jgi:diacylglycerol kinase